MLFRSLRETRGGGASDLHRGCLLQDRRGQGDSCPQLQGPPPEEPALDHATATPGKAERKEECDKGGNQLLEQRRI